MSDEKRLLIRIPQKILVPPTTIGVLKGIVIDEDGTLSLIDVWGVVRYRVKICEPSTGRS